MSYRSLLVCLCVVAVGGLSIRPVPVNQGSSVPGFLAGFPGVGVCDGGACSQCSPTVYNIENDVMVELVKFYQKLQTISSSLMVDLYSVNRTVYNVNIVNTNSLNVQITAIKIAQTAIVTMINDITVVVNGLGGGNFNGIQQTLIKIERIQRILISITKSMTTMTRTIINIQGKPSVIINEINDVVVSITQLERTVILISQTIISFVSKMERITSISSTSILVRHIRIAIINIRTSSKKFVSIQQSFLVSIETVINLQKVHIQKITLMINKVMSTSTKISESLKFIDSYLANYNIALLQITVNVKTIKTVMSETVIKIKRHEEFVTKILSVLSHIKVVIHRNSASINSVHIDLQTLLSQERLFLQDISVLLSIISTQDTKLLGVIKASEAILTSINAKVHIVRENERKNANSIFTTVSAILSDISKFKHITSTNTRTASTLRVDVGVIEERLDDIMGYLAKLAAKCKKPPPSKLLCEAPQYTCAKMADVCGSDGVTYPSICQMRKIACLTKTIITLHGYGPCVPITTPKPPVDCAFTCPPEIKPVCASNGKTYSCECAMRLNACYLGITLTSTPGPCKGKPNPNMCSYNCYMVATNWVCGSDRNDYRNMCTMKEAACKLRKTITIATFGKCSGGPNPIRCPYPFIIVDQQCIYVTPPSTYGSYAVAKKDCERLGSNLVSFVWDKEWKAVQQHLIGIDNHQMTTKSMYWTGAKYDGGKWVWDQTKQPIFLSLAWNESGNHASPGNNRCAVMTHKHLHKMSARPCNTYGERIGWVCKK